MVDVRETSARCAPPMRWQLASNLHATHRSNLLKLKVVREASAAHTAAAHTAAAVALVRLLTAECAVFHACHLITQTQTRKNTHILKTRQPAEVARGSVPGALNFPLSSLRGNLQQLPQDKRLYVFCQVCRLTWLRMWLSHTPRSHPSCCRLAAATAICSPQQHPATVSTMQVGLRGYNATRQLLLAGRDAVNVSGGWRSAQDSRDAHQAKL